MSLTAVVRRQLWKFELLNRNLRRGTFSREVHSVRGKRKPWNRNVFSSETKRQKRKQQDECSKPIGERL